MKGYLGEVSTYLLHSLSDYLGCSEALADHCVADSHAYNKA